MWPTEGILINGLFSGHPNLCRGLKGPCLSRGVFWDICVETEREGGGCLHRTIPRLCLDYSLKTEITPQYEGGVDQSHIQGKNLICKFKSNRLLLMWMALWVCAAPCTWSFICSASTKPISVVCSMCICTFSVCIEWKKKSNIRMHYMKCCIRCWSSTNIYLVIYLNTNFHTFLVQK